MRFCLQYPTTEDYNGLLDSFPDRERSIQWGCTTSIGTSGPCLMSLLKVKETVASPIAQYNGKAKGWAWRRYIVGILQEGEPLVTVPYKRVILNSRPTLKILKILCKKGCGCIPASPFGNWRHESETLWGNITVTEPDSHTAFVLVVRRVAEHGLWRYNTRRVDQSISRYLY